MAPGKGGGCTGVAPLFGVNRGAVLLFNTGGGKIGAVLLFVTGGGNTGGGTIGAVVVLSNGGGGNIGAVLLFVTGGGNTAGVVIGAGFGGLITEDKEGAFGSTVASFGIIEEGIGGGLGIFWLTIGGGGIWSCFPG